MPNPDVDGQLGTSDEEGWDTALVSQTAGAGRASSISSVLQGAEGEREKTRDKEAREIWTDPSWCTQNNLAPPLLSNCHNTNQLPSSSGAELSLLAQI